MALNGFWTTLETTTDSKNNKYINNNWAAIADSNNLWDTTYNTSICYAKIPKDKVSILAYSNWSTNDLQYDFLKIESDILLYRAIKVNDNPYNLDFWNGFYPENTSGSTYPLNIKRNNNLQDPYTKINDIKDFSNNNNRICLSWDNTNTSNIYLCMILAYTSNSVEGSGINKHIIENPSSWIGDLYSYYNNTDSSGNKISELYPLISQVYISNTSLSQRVGTIFKATLGGIYLDSDTPNYVTLQHCINVPSICDFRIFCICNYRVINDNWSNPSYIMQSGDTSGGWFCGFYTDYMYKSYSYYSNPETVNRDFIFAIPNNILTKEKIIEYCSLFAIVFTTKEGEGYDSDYTYCPIIGSDGNVTGTTSGSDNNSNDFGINPGSEAISKAKDFTLDTNEYISDTDLEEPENSPVGHFNRTFAISANTVDSLADKLYTADESVWEEIIEGLNLHGANPIEALIDLRMYPFNVPSYCGTSSSSIILGRTDLGISGLRINKNASCIIDLGNCVYPQLHGDNFLDSEPYTQASLYIPYCGVTPIPSAVFRGKTISVKMIVDLVTGACTAVIYCNGIIWNYVNGQMGISIPMTSTDSATYAANMLNSLTGMAGSTLQTAASAASSNVIGAASGALGMVNAASSLNSNIGNIQYQSSGSPSPCTSNNTPGYCYFCIEYNTVREASLTEYAHTVGYACSISGVVGSVSGYSVYSNIEYIGSGTQSEKDEIISLLTSGVYV